MEPSSDCLWIINPFLCNYVIRNLSLSALCTANKCDDLWVKTPDETTNFSNLITECYECFHHIIESDSNLNLSRWKLTFHILPINEIFFWHLRNVFFQIKIANRDNTVSVSRARDFVVNYDPLVKEEKSLTSIQAIKLNK